VAVYTKLKEIKFTAFNDVLEITYFKSTNLEGKVRYSSEIIFRSGDKVIIDDKTLSRLESKINLLIPASIYSRVIAGMISSK